MSRSVSYGILKVYERKVIALKKLGTVLEAVLHIPVHSAVGVGSVDTVSSILVVAADWRISVVLVVSEDSPGSVFSEQAATDMVSSIAAIMAEIIFKVPRL